MWGENRQKTATHDVPLMVRECEASDRTPYTPISGGSLEKGDASPAAGVNVVPYRRRLHSFLSQKRQVACPEFRCISPSRPAKMRASLGGVSMTAMPPNICKQPDV